MTEARRQAWRRGRWAELACAMHLRLRGYRILAQRLRSPVGEIDILARRGAVLAIIEVKARADLTTAADALTAHQQRRLIRAAGWLIAGRPGLAGAQIRFDAMLVAPWRIPRHVVDAWRVDPQWLNSSDRVAR